MTKLISELLADALIARAKLRGVEAGAREEKARLEPVVTNGFDRSDEDEKRGRFYFPNLTDEARAAMAQLSAIGRRVDDARAVARDTDAALVEAIVGDAPRIEGDEPAGLHPKYLVLRNDGSSRLGGKHFECDYLVLDWNHDKYARAAALAYADACEAELPELAADIRARAALVDPPAEGADEGRE